MKERNYIFGWILGLCAVLLLFCLFLHPGDTLPQATAPSSTPSAPDSSATPTVSPTQTPSATPTATPTPTPVVTPTPFPQEPAPDDHLVRIGLKHGSTALDKLTVSSDSGGTLGIVKNKIYVPAVGFTGTDSIIAKPNSGYHLQLSSATTTFSEAQYALYEIRQICNAAQVNISVFYLYDGTNWSVGTGFYTTAPTAATAEWTQLAPLLEGTNYTLSAHKAGLNSVRVSVNNTPVLVTTTGDTKSKIRIHPLPVQDGATVPPLIRIDKSRYRGDFDVHRLSGSKLVVVNELEVEEYLYSVVPAEMIAGSTSEYTKRIEGLKAQAVMARTAAYLNVFNGYLKEYDFHLYCDTNSQMYGGYTRSWGGAGEHYNSTQAVIQTKGQAITYNGTLISNLFYSANSGGYTETPNNVWYSAIPYYISKPDPWTEPEIDTPTFTGKTLSQKISAYVTSVDVGNVEYVNVVSRSQSGRVIQLLVEGSKSDAVLLRSATRSVLGLKSQLYNFNTDTVITIQNHAGSETNALSERARTYLEGNTFTTAFLPDCYAVRGANGYLYERLRVYPNSTQQVFSLTVKGYGHGVGMSQDGADAMSTAGKKYDEIIHFYLYNVEIKTFEGV